MGEEINMKDDFDNPEYLIDTPSGKVFNLSKWVRENTPQAEHKFKEGDIVALTIITQVEKLTRDVDGTPLYVLEGRGGGWSEESMRLATDEEKKDNLYSDE